MRTKPRLRLSSLVIGHLAHIACASVTLAGGSASAQHASPPDSSFVTRPGALGGELWLGYSRSSTVAGVLGRHGGISLGLAGLRMNRVLRASDSSITYYTLDLLGARVTPLVNYSDNAVIVCPPPKYDCVHVPVVASGFGITPLGLTTIFRPSARVQWRLGANGGAVMLDRPAPSNRSARFNFTAAIEGGFQFVRSDGAGVLVVYRLHHLSNAGRADDNLAMLSHVISIGMNWLVPERARTR